MTHSLRNRFIRNVLFVAGAMIGYALLCTVLIEGKVWAHQATPTASQPLGWAYGIECCSSKDCADMPAGEITSTPEGWRVASTGEVIPYGDHRIKRSRDERFHRCAIGGDFTRKRSLCLYVPDLSF